GSTGSGGFTSARPRRLLGGQHAGSVVHRTVLYFFRLSRFRSARLRLRLALPRRDRECVRDVADRPDRALVVEDHRAHVEAAGPRSGGLEIWRNGGPAPRPGRRGG